MAAKTSTTKTSKPIADVKPAGKSSDPELIISSRPVIGHDESPEQDMPEQVAATPAQSKRTVIKPLTLDDAPEKADEAAAEAPDPSSLDDAPAAPSATKEPVVETAASTEKESQDSSESASPDAGTPDLSQSDTKKLDKEAEQQAAEEAKRQAELQKYIESREFNVPINSVAQRRSIKVSLGLTLVVLLLAILLVDLMLDSGLILLVQKIPHTHFFELN